MHERNKWERKTVFGWFCFDVVFVARWSVVFLYRLIFENKKKLRNDIAKIFQTNKIVLIFEKNDERAM